MGHDFWSPCYILFELVRKYFLKKAKKTFIKGPNIIDKEKKEGRSLFFEMCFCHFTHLLTQHTILLKYSYIYLLFR
jgi:hypothetical protein